MSRDGREKNGNGLERRGDFSGKRGPGTVFSKDSGWWKEYAGFAAVMSLLVLLGGWHFLDVQAGTQETGDFWLRGGYLFLFAGVVCGLSIFYCRWFVREKPLSSYAPLLIFVSGCLYMLVLAPLSAPDEIAHFMSAYKVSSHMLGQSAVDEGGFILIRREDDFLQNIYGAGGDEERISLGRRLDAETYAVLKEHGTSVLVDDAGKEMHSSVYRPVNTTPLAYVPQALGIAAARLIGLNGVVLAFMGRLCNLAFFTVFVCLAIRLFPGCGALLLGVSLLPMTLHVAASYSYDAFVISLSFFFASYCLKLAFLSPEVRKRDLAVLAAVIAALGPCKIVYGLFMGFALLIPREKFGGTKQWLASAAVVLSAFAGAVAVMNRTAFLGLSSETENLIAWAGEEGYELSFLLHRPVRFLDLFYETICRLADEWYLTMLGAKLGNLDPLLSTPFPALMCLTVCLVLLGSAQEKEVLYLNGWQKAWLLFLAAGCLAGLMAVMLLSLTPVSSQVILGVQGRYLLPFLPFVLMTLKSSRLLRTGGRDEGLIFLMSAVNGYVLLRLFGIVSMRV
ncbi:MAG: DUF2142 domain-containing protein [Lachnospiraceae bacterium]|jgi:hypothetical protein|nr:DUF2142 domain-containing protein [Lachnospiraceae bacterium]NBJ82780.1 DUF2142 domain-containing protein [bacterium 1XD42-76]NBK06071.1 DUF2142 domain-containing protein [bacterium 1XD42-94]